MTLPPTLDLLTAWDNARPRTQQTAMGMSALGSCRRQAGYHLQGYESDPEFVPQKVQAMLGTAIHEAAAAGAKLLVPEAMAENLEVEFGGLKGHPDIYYQGVVRDIKTVGYAMVLESRKLNGPPDRERYQVHTYGAGLLLAGYDVHTVEIDYIDRSSGAEWIFSEPWSLGVVAEAMGWLDDVRNASVSLLSRDYRPESAFCLSCPFFRRCWDAEPGRDPRSVLFRDNPDAALWAAQLERSNAMRKEAEAEGDDARGALDALRTVSRPGESEDIEVPGLDHLIRFSVSRGRTSPDMARIAVDYARAGTGADGKPFRPPMRVGEPVVKVTLVRKGSTR